MSFEGLFGLLSSAPFFYKISLGKQRKSRTTGEDGMERKGPHGRLVAEEDVM